MHYKTKSYSTDTLPPTNLEPVPRIQSKKLEAQTKDSTPILLPLKLPRFLIQIRIAN